MFVELGMANDQRQTTNDSPARSDEIFMEEAIRCAQRALEMNEVPVGAVVVSADAIIARGWNRNITDSDATAHAEIVALREASNNPRDDNHDDHFDQRKAVLMPSRHGVDLGAYRVR